MNKDKIKQLIAAKIAGQGSAIDAASVLPTILDAIIDIIPSGGVGSQQITMNLGELFESKTAEEAAEIFGISDEEFARLISGDYCSALTKGAAISYLLTVDFDGEKVFFFNGDPAGIGCAFYLAYSGGLYTFDEV